MSVAADRAETARLFKRPEAPGARLQVVYYPGSVLFGQGTISNLGMLARRFGTKALLVTYVQGKTSKAGIARRVTESLTAAGIEVVAYEIEPSPYLRTIDDGAARLRESGADFVVGAGGGSVLDSAKAIAALAASGGRWEDYQMGRATLSGSAVPVVAVPTTAGTGSEATAVAVVGNHQEGIIKSVSHPVMLPALVILDPDLTTSVPAQLTALVGLDALAHAMESYVSPKASPITEQLSLQALDLVGKSLLSAVSHAQDVEARGDMLLASHLAGQALNAGVGAAHILAQPISAVLGIGHPNALSTVLEHTVAYNEKYAPEKYRRVVTLLKPEAPDDEQPSAVIGSLLRDLGLDRKLSDYGATSDDVPRILDAVVRSTGHIWTNPRPVTLEALEQILRAAL